MRGCAILFSAAGCLLGASPAAHASGTYYVDRASVGGACSDSRDAGQATSPATPWCSLARAVEAAPSGATVLVRAGDHPQLRVSGDHRRTGLVTLRPNPGEAVTLDGFDLRDTSRLRLEGFRVTDSGDLRAGVHHVHVAGNHFDRQRLWLQDASDVLVEGNHVHDIPASASGKIGIRLMRGSRNLVRGNLIEHLVEDPIQATEVQDTVIEGNTIRHAHPADDEHTDCIQVLGADGLAIRGNYIRDVEHCLMFTDFPTRDVTIENNVVADVDGLAMKADGGGTPNLRVLNNTFHDAGHGVDLRTSHPGGVVANNIFDRVSSLDDQPVATHNIVTDGGSGLGVVGGLARYQDEVGFELAPGSPAIDAGNSLFGPASDRHGRPRTDDPLAPDLGAGPFPHTDIGAHERTLPGQGGQAPPPRHGHGGGPGGSPGTLPGGGRPRLRAARRMRLRRACRRGIRVRVVGVGRAHRVRVALRRGRRTVARRSVRVRGSRVTVRLKPRRLRAGRYRLVARLRARDGRVLARRSARLKLVR